MTTQFVAFHDKVFAVKQHDGKFTIKDTTPDFPTIQSFECGAEDSTSAVLFFREIDGKPVLHSHRHDGDIVAITDKGKKKVCHVDRIGFKCRAHYDGSVSLLRVANKDSVPVIFYTVTSGIVAGTNGVTVSMTMLPNHCQRLGTFLRDPDMKVVVANTTYATGTRVVQTYDEVHNCNLAFYADNFSKVGSTLFLVRVSADKKMLTISSHNSLHRKMEEEKCLGLECPHGTWDPVNIDISVANRSGDGFIVRNGTKRYFVDAHSHTPLPDLVKVRFVGGKGNMVGINANGELVYVRKPDFRGRLVEELKTNLADALIASGQEMRACEQKNTELETQLAEAQTACHKTTDELHAREQEIAKLKVQVAASQTALEKTRNALHARGDRIDDLKAQLAAAQTTSANLTDVKQRLTGVQEQLQKQMHNAQLQAQELKAARTQVASLSEQLKQKSDEQAVYKNKYNDVMYALSKMISEGIPSPVPAAREKAHAAQRAIEASVQAKWDAKAVVQLLWT
ncbi:hypothetical protein OAM67_01260 [bacterium]|nr:hypothetical protein [bacterium]